MAEKWLVLKFGGTSAAGAQQWETIAFIVRARRSGGYRVVLVCSAVSGVTDLLEALSVDLVATSETTTTVAINREASHLDGNDLARLVSHLAECCSVRLFENCVCVNLVGRGMRTSLVRLQPVLAYFGQHRLLMLSQSANDLCLSMLVNAGDQDGLLQSAHDALIPSGDRGPEDVFGDSWQQIQAAYECNKS